MSTYNPRILALALEDLHEEMDRWAEAASQTLSAASESQRYGVEAVDQAMHRAAVATHEAEVDRESVERTLSTVAGMIDKCLEARHVAEETLSRVQSALELARSTLLNWQNELRLAREWLARAKARLALARQMLQEAVRAYEAARAELERAESAYRACASEKGRNCIGPSIALRAAQVGVQHAAAQVQIAQQEVEAAQLEVAQAEKRVACCERAVGFSEQAVSLAEAAVSEANEAINAAERSHETALAAERSVRQAERFASMELEETTAMQAASRAGQTSVEEAFAHLKHGDHMEDSSQRYSKNARLDLENRRESLYEMNRPVPM